MKTDPQKILIQDFDYALTPDRIAEFPLEIRDRSRLLVYHNGKITDDIFNNLSHHLPEETTIIVNDTKVIEARIFFQKPTGGIIEIFCLEPFHLPVEESLVQKGSVQWQCLIGGASKWKPGQILQKQIIINSREVSLQAQYIARQVDDFIIEFSWQPGDLTFGDIIHAAGAIPLPPYIKREATEYDAERYQTIFSKQDGSVAAPTSALHFTPGVFEELQKKNIHVGHITLHVGAGTFKPVKTENIAGHAMHSEPFSVSLATLKKIISARTLVAVGTTSLRTLESLHWIAVKLMKGLMEGELHLQQWEAYDLADKFPDTHPDQSLNYLVEWMNEQKLNEIHCHTSLIIIPGYKFTLPEGLITNFHQPRSTLLLLVSAFIGDEWKRVYRHALDNDYRFLSYGDSSLLWRDS